MNYRHSSYNEDNFQLLWTNLGRGGAAIGKCLIFDLFDNSVDANNYEQAFKGAGFTTKRFDHPAVKVSIISEYIIIFQVK